MDCPRCHAPSPDTQAYCAQCGASLHGPAAAAAAADAPTEYAAHLREDLDAGSTFAGRYQIIEELGRGGMGRVYKALDREVRGKVALKLIRPEIAADPAAIDRFRDELKTARGLSHPNICRVYDLGRDGDRYFLTMEYVSGEDLKSMIAMSGQLGVATALSIAKQVCDGLGEAHRHGVVHRDLKPQNIQIDKGGHARIMDFGIARSAAARGLTGAGVALGTPQYMAPEQVEASEVDARSDLYSLGIILYEMLTGRVPFDGDTPLSVAMKQKLEPPRDPRELNAAIPPDLGRAVLRCLEKEPARRYQRADELHADLVSIEQGLPTAERIVPRQRATTSREITVHVTMRQLLVPSLAVAVLLAASLGAWWLWPRKGDVGVAPPGGKPTVAVLYFENISGDPSLNAWRSGLPELLTTGLLDSRALNVVSTDRVFGILKKLNLADAPRYSDGDLANVAREGAIQYLVTGSVMKAGQSTVVTARLQRAGARELLDSRKIECASEQEILSKADGLTAHIRAAISPSGGAADGGRGEPLGQILTSSPEALRYYTEARRFHLNNEYSDAIRLYEQAIDADPGFAMAYRGMAACYSNSGDIARADTAASKALSLGDRLPERLKYQVQITAHSEHGNYAGAMEASNRLLATYPDDTIALNKLGAISEEGEEFDTAVGHFTMAAQSSPTLLSAENLAVAHRFLGHYDESAAVLSAYIERDPDNARAHVALGLSHAAAGRLDDAKREADRASLLAPSDAWVLELRGSVAYLRGEWPAAERDLTLALARASEADEQAARASLADLYAAQGRFEKAREHARQTPAYWGRAAALELDIGHPERAAGAFHAALAQPSTAYRPLAELALITGLGLSRAAAGDSRGAQKAAADLEAKSRPFFVKPATRWTLAISGALAATRGDGGAAIGDLERAAASLPFQSLPDEEHALMLDLLAQAYVAAGDLTKAQRTYERIAGLTTGRSMWGATYARSFYRRGQIAERQGDLARARDSFTKFLDLWKDADPGQPEVADAKKRLGR